jgi:hypothetical protein
VVLKGKPHVFERRTIHHSESAQEVKACCVYRNDELPPYDNNRYIFNSKELEELQNNMTVRANQEAALEPNKSATIDGETVFTRFSVVGNGMIVGVESLPDIN